MVCFKSKSFNSVSSKTPLGLSRRSSKVLSRFVHSPPLTQRNLLYTYTFDTSQAMNLAAPHYQQGTWFYTCILLRIIRSEFSTYVFYISSRDILAGILNLVL